jgi:hypothetical protein
MRLAVTDMPEHFPAQIANGITTSVFSRVVNLALDTEDGSRTHVTIDARNNAPLAPGTARLDAPAALDFSRLVSPGAGFAMRAGVLRIQGAELAFDFRAAAPISWAQKQPRTNRESSRLVAGWIDAWSLFTDAPGSAGFAMALFPDTPRSAYDRALARRVQITVPELMRASAKSDMPVAVACLRSLLGSGPGLTPSGDDFATGYFLGIGHVACEREQMEFLRRLIRAALVQSSDSTDISHAYLAHAAAGRFSAPLTCLVDGIGAHTDDIPARLADVTDMGHSSGRDTVLGLLCGLAVHEPALRERVINKLNEAHLHEKVTR